MRLLIRSVMTFVAVVFISSIGFVGHVTAQPAKASMTHHGGADSSSISCVTLCNSAPVSFKEKDSDSEKVNDDDDTLPPFFITTTGQGIQASSLEHASVSRYITTLEPPPLNAMPHILFAVFRT